MLQQLLHGPRDVSVANGVHCAAARLAHAPEPECGPKDLSLIIGHGLSSEIQMARSPSKGEKPIASDDIDRTTGADSEAQIVCT